MFDVAVARQHRRRRLRPPTSQSREPVGAVTHQGQVVGNRLGRHAEALHDTGPVGDPAVPAVKLHHPAVVAHALGQILVGGADHDSIHCRIGGRPGRRCGHGVVGLVVGHRPDRETCRGGDLLEQGELRQEVRIDTLATLVAGIHLVAERRDHMVGGDADMRRAVGNHPQQAAHHRPGGRHFPPGGGAMRRAGEELSEQLVRPIDEVDLHRVSAPPAPPFGRSPTPGPTR